MKDLSIVIVNWNSKDFVRECLKSLNETCKPELPRIIVVDGASFDGCDEMLEREFPGVDYVQSPENIGFGRSNNLGFEEVRSEFVLLLNPDTEVQEGALQKMMKYLRAHPEAGIVGARLLNTDGSLQTSSIQALPTPLNQALDSNFLRRLFPKLSLWGTAAYLSDKPSQVEAISGACMLMRAEVFAKVGGFDSSYFMYAEDMDLSWSVTQAGFVNTYIPDAEIIHHGGGSSAGEFSQFSNIAMRESLLFFMKKRLGAFAGLRYRIFLGISAFFRCCLLIPASVFVSREQKPFIQKSVKRWVSTLKWALGGERQKVKSK